MNSEADSTAKQPPRIVFTALKPKRRCKPEEPVPVAEPVVEEHAPEAHEPVLINARSAFARHRERIRRTGHATVQWRRITPPNESSIYTLPREQRVTLLRIKPWAKDFHSRPNWWGLLRGWVLAFR